MNYKELDEFSKLIEYYSSNIRTVKSSNSNNIGGESSAKYLFEIRKCLDSIYQELQFLGFIQMQVERSVTLDEIWNEFYLNLDSEDPFILNKIILRFAYEIEKEVNRFSNPYVSSYLIKIKELGAKIHNTNSQIGIDSIRIMHEFIHLQNVIQVSRNYLSVFEKIPVEDEYPLCDSENADGVKYQDLLNLLKYSLDELKELDTENTPVRKVKHPNGQVKIQLLKENLNRKKRLFSRKKVYADFQFEKILFLLNSLQNDIREIDEKASQQKIPLQNALISVRDDKHAVIHRNHQFFKNWEKDCNAFLSLRDRYSSIIALFLLIFVVATVVYSKFSNYGTLFTFFKSIDITIISVLLIILAYITYLVVYSLIEKTGQFDTRVIFSLNYYREKARSNIDTFNSTKQKNQTSSEDLAKSSLDDHIKIFIEHLESDKKDILINYLQNDASQENITLAALNFLKKRTHSASDKILINKILPKQLVIIPAVNDPHLIELVQKKISLNTYPNTEYLIALEERDDLSMDLIRVAVKEGMLPNNVNFNIGHIELSNKPGFQLKPNNKPKNVNKAICKYLNDLEYNMFVNKTDEEYPDFVMIWDLEDEPGESQIWSMILVNRIINHIVENIYLYSFESVNLKYKNHRDLLSYLKTNNIVLYKNIIKYGIDVRLLFLLYKRYNKFSLSIENSLDPNYLISKINIKSDRSLYTNSKNTIEQIDASELSNEQKEARIGGLKRIISDLNVKYSNSISFVKHEFLRRNEPADIQAILVPKMYGENPWSILEWGFWFDLVLPGLLRYRFDGIILSSSLIGALFGYQFFGVLGIFAGSMFAAILGYFLGKLLLSINIDTRNKVGLSFSAGTSNNYKYNVLVNYLNIYPEYNIAEDWSLALELAKNKFRSHLVCGYNTPTFEDSLAPLFKPMWNQHSRWIGGHFQSFPQVFVKFRIILKEYGLMNWLHSFFMIVLFSLTPIFSAYVIIKFIAYGVVFILNEFSIVFGWVSIVKTSESLILFLDRISNWLYSNQFESIFCFLLGLFVIMVLGLIPIFRPRSDDHLMVQKSIEELKRKKTELENKKNPDIENLYTTLEKIHTHIISIISSFNESNFSRSNLQAGIETYQANGDTRLYYLFNGHHIKRIVSKSPASKVEAIKYFDELIENIIQKLDENINKDVKRLEARINNLEKGLLFGISIGTNKLTLVHRFVLNFTMVYYYFNSLFSVIIYFGQIWRGWDNQWRQTGHRNVGSRYLKFVQKTIK
ncbi:MAG: hypothetical protein WD607_00125 [Candidatus Paceibacterota bacterium]